MVSHNASNAQLKAIVDRIERIETEIKERQNDRSDIYAEAKANGYHVKALRTIIQMRKQDANERAETETILDTYLIALGMGPLFEHAAEQHGPYTTAPA